MGTQLSDHSSLGPSSHAGSTPHPQSNGSIEGRGQTQGLPPAPGAVPSVTPSPFSRCTCEPQECAALPEAVSHLFDPSHQRIHLAQGGSVDAPARGGGQRGGQRDVHMGQGQVEEEGMSTVTAQGTQGQCSASRGRQEVIGMVSLGTQTMALPPLPLPQLPGGKPTHVHHPAANPPGTPLLTGRKLG